MDELKLKELWQSVNKKAEESLTLNKKNTEDISKMKVQNFVSSMKPIKIFTLLTGIIWVGLGAIILTNLFVYASAMVSKFFLISAAIQLLLTALAILIYIYQLILIYQVDISEPILATQEKLAKLKSSTLLVTRILFLQLPLWTTFYLSENMFKNGNLLLFIIQGVVTFSFTYLAIWLFVNIKYENKDKKWFRFIFSGKEWLPIIKAMELCEDVRQFKQDD